RENDAMENFRKRTGVKNLVSHYRDVQEPFAKILFGCEHEDGIRQIEALLRTHRRADEFDFIRSERTLFEILPKGITKGTSVTKLCEYLKLERRHVLAIGDYNNDVPMLRAAGVGIAVQNACREALEAADHITVSNEEHALARVICDLERGKFDV
ncbi:MAG: HAD hydrolase family protein, partial [Oscillospiraceae bacterium]|nr:HAD hydrolase family protein [Oscillospiraceae bacterium]